MKEQRGAALLVALVILIFGGLFTLLPKWLETSVASAKEKQSSSILISTRDALLGFSVSALNGYRPGDMPFPDALSKNEAPRNYDGKADTGGCVDRSKSDGTLITSGENMRCLGRLPWRDLGQQLPDDSENDPTGVMPWYAVSANLVDPCLKSINSGVLNLLYPGSYPPDCPGTPTDSQLPHPWLTIRDAQGNVFSDRVAFIVILPGPPIGTQIRSPSPNLGGAKEYLDTYVVRVNSTGCPNGATTPCVFRNDDLDNDFIVGDPNDPKNTFNDRLLYVTIDELLVAAEKRALTEAAAQLRTFYRNSGASSVQRYYPYASKLGDSYFNCQKDLRQGHLPANNGCQCYCTNKECGCRNCPTGVLNSASFTNSSTFSSRDGACTATAHQCNCTGNGWCRGTSLYQGTATISTGTPLPFRVSMIAPIAPIATPISFSADSLFTQYSSQCTLIAGSCQCTGTGLASQSGSCSGDNITTLSTLNYRFANNASGRLEITQTTCPHSIPSFPAWLTDNDWLRYIYFTLAPSCSFSTPGCAGATLSAGGRNGLHALVIGTGPALQIAPIPQPKQTGFPSTNIADYLDSIENTNGDDMYDDVGSPPSSTYNDKTVIVCPGEITCTCPGETFCP